MPHNKDTIYLVGDNSERRVHGIFRRFSLPGNREVMILDRKVFDRACEAASKVLREHLKNPKL